ncbi:MAG TPA: DUF4870 domain-containing protein [Bryobacteraceae bacterium]|nr:DUF4870 domain-containing protein [Bryobacteraceae bacterium]
MAFCKNCGSPVEGKFCGKCGTPVAAAAAGQQAAPASYGQPQEQQYAAAPAPQAGGLSENVAGLLCYVAGFITGIVFLSMAPHNQSKFVRFHAWQFIFFSGAWIGLWIVNTILGMILPWALMIIVSLLSLVVWLGGMVVWILLMVKASQGQKWQLPVIGPMAEKQA